MIFVYIIEATFVHFFGEDHDVDKKFGKWLGKLMDAGIVFVVGDVVHVIIDI